MAVPHGRRSGDWGVVLTVHGVIPHAKIHLPPPPLWGRVGVGSIAARAGVRKRLWFGLARGGWFAGLWGPPEFPLKGRLGWLGFTGHGVAPCGTSRPGLSTPVERGHSLGRCGNTPHPNPLPQGERGCWVGGLGSTLLPLARHGRDPVGSPDMGLDRRKNLVRLSHRGLFIICSRIAHRPAPRQPRRQLREHPIRSGSEGRRPSDPCPRTTRPWRRPAWRRRPPGGRDTRRCRGCRCSCHRPAWKPHRGHRA